MKKAGEIIAESKTLSKAAAVTPAMERILQAAEAIRMDPDGAEKTYMARELVQCTLPHSDPGQVPFWSRTNGNITLAMTSGVNADAKKLVGYPYGSIPRLILFWLTTEALRTGSRKLYLGRSYASFLRDVGLDPRGRGKRSAAKRVREQTGRLFSATVSFIGNVERQGAYGERRLNMTIAADSELWWNPKQPDQANLWESWVELGEKFYEALIASAVPLDIRHLRELKKSPLALDLYAWGTHKAYVVSRTGRSQYVPWKMLAQQFGAEYRNYLDFKRKAKEALRKITAVYPGLKLSDETGGVTVLATSLPAVPVLRLGPNSDK